jgi:hypothetical protein
MLKRLIIDNRELVEKTAIGNCHCIGLNSFIINERPKMRLFIAEENCELFNKFDFLNPIIPIHPHKYDDLFVQLEGEMIHHLYEVDYKGNEYNKYRYARLSDKETEIINIGKEKLNYLGGKKVKELKSTELHTASLSGKRCSWVITETLEDKNFQQVAYHQDLKSRPELYKKIIHPFDYLKTYFNI